MNGATVHLTGTGTCSVTASQGGNANFGAAADVTQSFAITNASQGSSGLTAQTITFASIANVALGTPDFRISATASSSLPVTFTAKGNCTVTPSSAGFGLVHLTAKGTCTITASQAGDATHAAAPAISRSFTISAFSTGKATGSGLKTGNGGTASFAIDGGKKLTGTLSWHRRKVQFDAARITKFAILAGGKAAWIYGVGKDGRKFMAYVADNGTTKKGASDPDVFKLWIAGNLVAGGKLTAGNVKVTR